MGDAIAQAGLDGETLDREQRRILDLVRQRLARAPHLLAPPSILDNLFERERDQHAQDDNAYFLGELAPAVERFRQMDMHTAPPRA